MKNILLGNIYFIKDGKILKEKAYLSRANASIQSFLGLTKPIKLYSDKEIESGSEDISDIYKDILDDNCTIVRAFNKAVSSMGEVTLLDDYDVDIYIPIKPSMMDIKPLKEILSNYNPNNSTITNFHDNYYDFYSYIYNYSSNKRNLSEICEYYYKEKNLILNDNEKEMFDKYRNFNMPSLVLEDYSKYTLNNRNTGIVIIMPELTVKRTVTKSFHKRECLDILKKFYAVNNNSTYIDLVNDYNLIIGIITEDTISAYVSNDINDYQLDKLSSFIKDTYDIKSLKNDLITNANIVKDKKIVFDGELSDLNTYFTQDKIK